MADKSIGSFVVFLSGPPSFILVRQQLRGDPRPLVPLVSSNVPVCEELSSQLDWMREKAWSAAIPLYPNAFKGFYDTWQAILPLCALLGFFLSSGALDLSKRNQFM